MFMSWEDDNSRFQGSLPSRIYVKPGFVDCRPCPAIASSVKEKKRKKTSTSLYRAQYYPLKETSTLKREFTVMK